MSCHAIEMIPAIAQYKANHTSFPFFTSSIIHLQAAHPTRKAAMNPTVRGIKPMLWDVNASPEPEIIFRQSRKASPRMGIITMKNENWASWSRRSPSKIPVAMVEPERLRPGRTAIAWAHPMIKASIQVISRPGILTPSLRRILSGSVFQK